jgi:hypothetical protein
VRSGLRCAAHFLEGKLALKITNVVVVDFSSRWNGTDDDQEWEAPAPPMYYSGSSPERGHLGGRAYRHPTVEQWMACRLPRTEAVSLAPEVSLAGVPRGLQEGVNTVVVSNGGLDVRS